jgi:hypothetical protein
VKFKDGFDSLGGRRRPCFRDAIKKADFGVKNAASNVTILQRARVDEKV